MAAVKSSSEGQLDNYADFDFKRRFLATTTPETVPAWMPDDDKRRLRSYFLLEAYCRNKGREWTQTSDTSKKVDSTRREYGDPHLLVETALSSLIGDNWSVMIPEALEKEEGGTATQTHETLQKWLKKVRFGLKLYESERQSVKFGDSVYVLGMDDNRGRVTLNVYDPMFYFPVLDDEEGGSEDFPKKIHIAWEFEKENQYGKEQSYVRRMTWELSETETPYSVPWSETKVTEQCYFTDVTVPLGDVKNMGLTLAGEEDQRPRSAVYVADNEPLGIDFLPVIHVPNTINLQNHFGRSVLTSTLQILDDLINTDTDLQASSGVTGSPPIVVTGRGVGTDTTNQVYGPGTVLNVGEGNATIMDTSRSLDALIKLDDKLLSRLSINGRFPESLLGRVKPNEVPSGIALTLSFTPHINMIREMREVREEKYPLLFKFAMRMMQVVENGKYELPSGEPLEAKMVFGSFLPADLMATADVVVKLLAEKAISRETAVRMMIEAGVPVERWPEEIALIDGRDFDSASSLAALTLNPQDGMDYLGREMVDPDFLDDALEDGLDDEDEVPEE